MPKKPSRNPVAILSISLPLSTRKKIEAFNPRNRSKMVNRAVLAFIDANDPKARQERLENESFTLSQRESMLIDSLTERRLAAILLNRLQSRGADQQIREAVLLLLTTDQEGQDGD